MQKKYDNRPTFTERQNISLKPIENANFFRGWIMQYVRNIKKKSFSFGVEKGVQVIDRHAATSGVDIAHIGIFTRCWIIFR